MSDAAEPNPTVARRRLAVRLSRLREENGRSLEDMASFLRVAHPQASRLDTGARGFPRGQVEKLAGWYGLSTPAQVELLELVAASRRRAWWQQVELADSYRTLIGMEQAAKSINEYGSWVIPGLLQTLDYARASASGDSFPLDEAVDAIDAAPQVRVRRQRLLERAESPRLRVVIDEGVLARTIGGKAVMSAQLAHLEAMSARERIEVRVIGFEVGAYPGGSLGHYILLEMGDGLPDVVYREGLDAPDDRSDEATLGKYWRAWGQIQSKALDPYASRALIKWYRSRLDPR